MIIFTFYLKICDIRIMCFLLPDFTLYLHSFHTVGSGLNISSDGSEKADITVIDNLISSFSFFKKNKDLFKNQTQVVSMEGIYA